MDPQRAQELLGKTASILCLDVPQGFEFGIDNHSWEVGPKFKGIKFVPEGLHYIFYSMKNKYGGSSAPRTSFFLHCKPKQVIIRKWDSETEDLLPLADKDEEERLALAVGRFEFDQFLGAFPWDDESSVDKWQKLTSFVTSSILARIEPPGQKIASTTKPLTSQEQALLGIRFKSFSKKEIEDSLTAASGLAFTPIPKHFKDAGFSGTDITKFNLDKSKLLEQVLLKNNLLDLAGQPDPYQLLGELQFAFVSFLMGHSFESFEQWKAIVTLLCSCDEAVVAHSGFFLDFIEVLKAQIGEIPEDFFVDILSGKNFLTATLSGFFEIIDDPQGVAPDLVRAGRELRKFTEKRFGKSFSVQDLALGGDFMEDDEDAPMIVET